MSTVETPTKERLAETSDERVCAETLAWMNDVRAEYGLEPLSELPRGVPGDAQGCALAAGLMGIADCSAPFPCGGRHSWPGDRAPAADAQR